MAKMIPSFGPQETQSYGERTVYSLLAEGLSDDFTVIHSLPWLSAAMNDLGMLIPPTGEIDFLVLHEKLGVLALEVKSGIYGVNGHIFVYLKSNEPVDIIRQTRNNVHGLARWLGGATKLYLRIGYGFIFPDSLFDSEFMNTAMIDTSVEPWSRIFIDKKNMSSLAGHVVDIMSYWKNSLNNGELGQHRLNIIKKAICSEYDGTPSWGARIIFDNQLWLRLTREQTSVIDQLSDHHRFVVTGWPGTGKTLIGIEFSRRLGSENLKTLIITFNSRLSEYISQQVNRSSCDVFTWHKLCHKARGKLRLDPNVPDNWFTTGCCEDLVEAIRQEMLEDYDALIIDEAQALQPQWLTILSKWFNGKRILAFCDESQIFSYEKGTSHHELCQIIHAPDPFNLTIVIRTPKAVTDYLITIRPSTYQLISPREAETDTLRELVVSDSIEILIDEITKLKENNTRSSDIFILLPSDKFKYELESDLEKFGVQLETVSRFRGLESPIIIALYASHMDDSQLFCAYSRATTAFIAIYDSEELAWGNKRNFTRLLINKEDNKNIIDSAKKESMTQSLMAEHFNSGLSLDLKTIHLTWSKKFSAWLIAFENENQPEITWLDYLCSSYPWPVLCWFDSSRRQLSLLKETNEDNDNFGGGMILRVGQCACCKNIAPIYKNKMCICCNPVYSPTNRTPSKEEVEKIKLFDEIIYYHDKNKEKIKLLPIALAAAGARRYGFMHAKRKSIISDEFPKGRLLYRSALAFVHSRIAYFKPGSIIELDKLTDELRNRYIHINEVDRKIWRHALACALSTCIGKKHIIKKDKGKYSIIEG
ncbi:nuclease-related domain-containing DEAD/DEAH box helicase [Pectobacterium polaris]|uniref:nuclease-related domain-containing DEAD/DEAH box helicase n=1 Tax=Pectobacterium polaris TaxID=2042057 RepID=UPI001583BA11|nr:AAA family ATPase [Pectobacterium polaris]